MRAPSRKSPTRASSTRSPSGSNGWPPPGDASSCVRPRARGDSRESPATPASANRSPLCARGQRCWAASRVAIFRRSPPCARGQREYLKAVSFLGAFAPVRAGTAGGRRGDRPRASVRPRARGDSPQPPYRAYSLEAVEIQERPDTNRGAPSEGESSVPGRSGERETRKAKRNPSLPSARPEKNAREVSLQDLVGRFLSTARARL